jgi:glycosyltransferase involved in cell wall biosynthesis
VIDKNLYKASNDFKRNAGISEDTSVLLFVGRFMHEKGILDLIEACRLLKQAQVKFVLFCLGNGPLVKDVTDFITSNGMEANIKLLGHIHENETRAYYSNCEILILPTYHQEGFPMAVFQAIGAGRPVITTRIRAAADYLAEMENCLWAEKQNPKQLYQQILLLMNDKALQEKMRVNNLLLAEKFSAEKIVNNLLGYFNKI